MPTTVSKDTTYALRFYIFYFFSISPVLNKKGYHHKIINSFPPEFSFFLSLRDRELRPNSGWEKERKESVLKGSSSFN